MVDAVSTGKVGAIKGFVAKWTYTFDSTVGFFYKTEAYVQSKN